MKKLYLLGSLLIQSSLILPNPGYTGLANWQALHSKLAAITEKGPSPISLPTAQEWAPLWAIANKASAEVLSGQMINEEWGVTVQDAQTLRLNRLFRKAEADLHSNSSVGLKNPTDGFCMYAYEWGFEKSLGNQYPLLYNGIKTGKYLPSPTDLLRSFVRNQQHLLKRAQRAIRKEKEYEQQSMPPLEGSEKPTGPPSPGEKRKQELENHGCGGYRGPRSSRTRRGTPVPHVHTTNPYAMLTDQDA
ncbi:hypothetical protein HOM50_05205 [bacterium]|mgnify:CR=1 FL=1|jgi:hypothetical protein|nr:hypothetical protein [bacterium]MBT5015779.1 hypothetical protein [bacterium]